MLSNRLPCTFRLTPGGGLTCERSPGGLVSALEPVLRERGGTWIGWPGGELDASDAALSEGLPYRIRAVRLSAAQVQGYYTAYSNGTLWPFFHSLVERADFPTRGWETYEQVNQRFAQVAAEAWDGEPLVWIHDYHLTRAPLHLRRLLPQPRLGFFLHIPFPSHDMFQLLPHGRALLEGLLACDLVAFHTEDYARHFLDCVERELGCRVDRRLGEVTHQGRRVRAAAFPLGVDFARLEALAATAPVVRLPQRIVLGVDRLDYTKGLPQRLRVFERLLERHPDHLGRVVLLQIAVPSRLQVEEYRRLGRRIDALIGHVNGRFATPSWTPVRYLQRCFPHQQLAGYYRDAQVALVTPLRDGMNLVAKEFCACQVDAPGALVLSRLAGAAAGMPEALQVNPYDLDETVEVLHQALEMPLAERAQRMRALRRRERRYDVHHWVRAQLAGLLAGPRRLELPAPV